MAAAAGAVAAVLSLRDFFPDFGLSALAFAFFVADFFFSAAILAT